MKTKGIDLLEASRHTYFMKLACGYVGSVIGIQFVDFVKKDYKVLTASEILDKFTDKMGEELKAMETFVVAFYNKLLLEYVQKHKKLSKKQVENLLSYYRCIQKEGAADLFNLLIREARDFMTKLWAEYPEVSKIIGELMGLHVPKK
jgi:hypothetical protein